jgi:hypothetical protein
MAQISSCETSMSGARRRELKMTQPAFKGFEGWSGARRAHAPAWWRALVTKGVCILVACFAAACGDPQDVAEDPSFSSVQAALTSPSALNPVAWYEASSGKVQLVDTTLIWDDSSGNNDLVQPASGSQPVYSATSWNGNSPAVTFDGSNDFFQFTSGGDLLDAFDGSDQEFSVLITWEPLDLDQDYDLMQWDNNGENGGNSLIELRTNAAGDDEARYRHRRGDGTTSVVNTGTPKFEPDRRITGFVFSGTALTIYDDDDVHLSSGSNDVGSLTLLRFRLGHGDNMPLNGRIAEVVILDTALDQSGYLAYRSYAQDRWGGL